MKNLGFFTETQPKQDTVKILSLTFAVPRSPFVICASGQNLKKCFQHNSFYPTIETLSQSVSSHVAISIPIISLNVLILP